MGKQRVCKREWKRSSEWSSYGVEETQHIVKCVSWMLPKIVRKATGRKMKEYHGRRRAGRCPPRNASQTSSSPFLKEINGANIGIVAKK
jgi:hypothetical protein